MTSDQWRDNLQHQLASHRRCYDSIIRQLFLDHRRQTAGEQQCCKCKLALAQRELIELPCRHLSCESCLRNTLSGYLEPDPRARLGPQCDALILLLRLRQRILLCASCGDTFIGVQTRRGFDPTISSFPPRLRAATGSIDTVVPLLHPSRHLREFLRTYSYYENERYVLFGSYSKDNLTIADIRGPTSDESDDAVDPSVFQLPNSRWYWVSDWHTDKSIGDADGWQYAVNWPGGVVPGAAWHNEKFSTAFVRRRRLRRIALHFSSSAESFTTLLD